MGRWNLGDGMLETDNIFDPVTFEEIITTVACNSKRINKDAVRLAAKQIIEMRMQDFNCMLDDNISEIVNRARQRRCS